MTDTSRRNFLQYSLAAGAALGITAVGAGTAEAAMRANAMPALAATSLKRFISNRCRSPGQASSWRPPRPRTPIASRSR